MLYRLDVAQVRLPALRERSDFALAVELTLLRIQPGATIDDDAVNGLRQHDWPGNFRELRAVLTRALLEIDTQGGAAHLGASDVAAHLPRPAPGAAGRNRRLHEAATQAVVDSYHRHDGNVSLVARELGISRTTAYRHLRQAGLHGDGAAMP